MAQKEKSILTPRQKRVLDLISQEKYFTERFYLAGGTALAEFYLKHRISEDLDLFCEKQERTWFLFGWWNSNSFAVK